MINHLKTGTSKENAILSIKSYYAAAIYQGVKLYEVRKTSIRPCKKIYLYETAPKRLITGYIMIGTPIKLSVERIIKEHLDSTFLTEKQLRLYAGDRQSLYLWPIIEAERCEPFKITYSAPQSFIYI